MACNIASVEIVAYIFQSRNFGNSAAPGSVDESRENVMRRLSGCDQTEDSSNR
jgi:hypothetical protein